MIITRGFIGNTIITRGYVYARVVRDIARLVSQVILSVSLTSAVKFTGTIISRVIKSATIISKLDIEEDN